VIDLHCHLLPGVDDGSESVQQSIRVLGLMQASGVTAVCLTPHHSVARLAAGIPSVHDQQFDALRARAPEAIKLLRGVELMLDRPITPELSAQPGLTLAGTRYILVEFPRLVALPAVGAALHQIVHLGLVPVLAHPERYKACSPGAVKHWKSLGAVMQVDATTLLSGHPGRGQRARELLAHGLADIMAADNHGDDRMIGTAYRYLAEQGGEHQADLLARKNPGAILSGGPLEPVPPFAIKTGLLDRLKQMLSEEE
jgi:protein-tyrosine phosphatase